VIKIIKMYTEIYTKCSISSFRSTVVKHFFNLLTADGKLRAVLYPINTIDNIQMQVYINLYYKNEINDTLITIVPIHTIWSYFCTKLTLS
jgi:hypothetical protein